MSDLPKVEIDEDYVDLRETPFPSKFSSRAPSTKNIGLRSQVPSSKNLLKSKRNSSVRVHSKISDKSVLNSGIHKILSNVKSNSRPNSRCKNRLQREQVSDPRFRKTLQVSKSRSESLLVEKEKLNEEVKETNSLQLSKANSSTNNTEQKTKTTNKELEKALNAVLKLERKSENEKIEAPKVQKSIVKKETSSAISTNRLSRKTSREQRRLSRFKVVDPVISKKTWTLPPSYPISESTEKKEIVSDRKTYLYDSDLDDSYVVSYDDRDYFSKLMSSHYLNLTFFLGGIAGLVFASFIIMTINTMFGIYAVKEEEGSLTTLFTNSVIQICDEYIHTLIKAFQSVSTL